MAHIIQTTLSTQGLCALAVYHGNAAGLVVGLNRQQLFQLIAANGGPVYDENTNLSGPLVPAAVTVGLCQRLFLDDTGTKAQRCDRIKATCFPPPAPPPAAAPPPVGAPPPVIPPAAPPAGADTLQLKHLQLKVDYNTYCSQVLLKALKDECNVGISTLVLHSQRDTFYH